MQSTSLPAATKQQEKLFDMLLDQIGCVVCHFKLRAEGSHGLIHHLVEGNKRVSHWWVLPLCEKHHTHGSHDHPSRHSEKGGSGGKYAFEEQNGTEQELMQLCAEWINWVYPAEFENEKRVSYEQEEDPAVVANYNAADHDSGTDSNANDQSADRCSEDQQIQVLENGEVDPRVYITVTHHRHGSADPDGLNAKAAIDAIVKAGVLPDDSARYVKNVWHTEKIISKKETEFTTIEITPVALFESAA